MEKAFPKGPPLLQIPTSNYDKAKKWKESLRNENLFVALFNGDTAARVLAMFTIPETQAFDLCNRIIPEVRNAWEGSFELLENIGEQEGADTKDDWEGLEKTESFWKDMTGNYHQVLKQPYREKIGLEIMLSNYNNYEEMKQLRKQRMMTVLKCVANQGFLKDLHPSISHKGDSDIFRYCILDNAIQEKWAKQDQALKNKYELLKQEKQLKIIKEKQQEAAREAEKERTRPISEEELEEVCKSLQLIITADMWLSPPFQTVREGLDRGLLIHSSQNMGDRERGKVRDICNQHHYKTFGEARFVAQEIYKEIRDLVKNQLGVVGKQTIFTSRNDQINVILRNEAYQFVQKNEVKLRKMLEEGGNLHFLADRFKDISDEVQMMQEVVLLFAPKFFDESLDMMAEGRTFKDLLSEHNGFPVLLKEEMAKARKAEEMKEKIRQRRKKPMDDEELDVAAKFVRLRMLNSSPFVKAFELFHPVVDFLNQAENKNLLEILLRERYKDERPLKEEFDVQPGKDGHMIQFMKPIVEKVLLLYLKANPLDPSTDVDKTIMTNLLREFQETLKLGPNKQPDEKFVQKMLKETLTHFQNTDSDSWSPCPLPWLFAPTVEYLRENDSSIREAALQQYGKEQRARLKTEYLDKWSIKVLASTSFESQLRSHFEPEVIGSLLSSEGLFMEACGRIRKFMYTTLGAAVGKRGAPFEQGKFDSLISRSKIFKNLNLLEQLYNELFEAGEQRAFPKSLHELHPDLTVHLVKKALDSVLKEGESKAKDFFTKEEESPTGFGGSGVAREVYKGDMADLAKFLKETLEKDFKWILAEDERIRAEEVKAFQKAEGKLKEALKATPLKALNLASFSKEVFRTYKEKLVNQETAPSMETVLLQQLFINLNNKRLDSDPCQPQYEAFLKGLKTEIDFPKGFEPPLLNTIYQMGRRLEDALRIGDPTPLEDFLSIKAFEESINDLINQHMGNAPLGEEEVERLFVEGSKLNELFGEQGLYTVEGFDAIKKKALKYAADEVQIKNQNKDSVTDDLRRIAEKKIWQGLRDSAPLDSKPSVLNSVFPSLQGAYEAAERNCEGTGQTALEVIWSQLVEAGVHRGGVFQKPEPVIGDLLGKVRGSIDLVKDEKAHQKWLDEYFGKDGDFFKKKPPPPMSTYSLEKNFLFKHMHQRVKDRIFNALRVQLWEGEKVVRVSHAMNMFRGLLYKDLADNKTINNVINDSVFIAFVNHKVIQTNLRKVQNNLQIGDAYPDLSKLEHKHKMLMALQQNYGKLNRNLEYIFRSHILRLMEYDMLREGRLDMDIDNLDFEL